MCTPSARVCTYQSAHKMVSKWPSSAETSDSQSHLTTLQVHVNHDRDQGPQEGHAGEPMCDVREKKTQYAL